jgi:hypothetical protein
VQDRQYHLTPGELQPHVKARETPNRDSRASVLFGGRRASWTLVMINMYEVEKEMMGLHVAILARFKIAGQAHLVLQKGIDTRSFFLR